MQVNKQLVVSKRLPELALANKPKLIISKEIQSQITYLHSRIGAIEWSSDLLYSVEQGSILDLDNLVLKAKGLLPYNKGDSTYTEYKTDVDIVDIFDMYPEYEEGLLRRGYCHTHHNMSCFFSPTDQKELHDNAGKYNYYLSLIVNFASEYCAKIAIVAENKKERISSESLVFKGDDAQPVTMPLAVQEDKDNKVLVLIDCLIEFEQEEMFKVKVDDIISKAAEKAKAVKPVPFNPLSKTNQYSNTYAKDVEIENKLDWTGFGQELGSVEVTDEKVIDRFLRKILSTKLYDLEDTKTFPKLIIAIEKIEKSLKDRKQVNAYLDSVEVAYEANFDTFFGKDVDGWNVSIDIGDYVDALVPMNEISDYDNLYSDISNLMWSLKRS